MPGKGPAAGGGGPPARNLKRAKVAANDGWCAVEASAVETMQQAARVRKGLAPLQTPSGAGDANGSHRGKAAPRTKPKPPHSDADVDGASPDATAPAKKRRKRGAAFWDSLPGWQEVEVGDDFLLGAEEGGFAGLEILDGPAVLDQYFVKNQGTDGADGEADGEGDDGGDLGAADEELPMQSKAGDGSGKGDEKKKKRKQGDKEGQAANGGEGVEQGTAAEDMAEAKAAAAAEAEERKRHQKERMKAKKARRKERRLQRLASGSGGGSGSGVDVSDDVHEGAGDKRAAVPAAATPRAADPPAKRRKQQPNGAAAAATAPDGVSLHGVDSDEDRKDAGESDDGGSDEAEHVDSGSDAEGDVDEGAEADEGRDADDLTEDGLDEPSPPSHQQQGKEDLEVDLSSWAEFELHPSVLAGLQVLRFSAPTPIQRECLHPAIRARADIIGAAQTGSGKTLAFGLPIMHLLAAERAAAAAEAGAEAGVEEAAEEEGGGAGQEQEDEDEDEDGDGTEEEGRPAEEQVDGEEEEQDAAAASGGKTRKQQKQLQRMRRKKQRAKQRRQQQQEQQQQKRQQQQAAWPKPERGPLRALILTPTRELALQVCSHLQAIGRPCGVRVAAIVGGISDVKQARLLAARPAVLVATPGRLWDLMCRPPSTDRHGSAAAAHLAELSRLSFLVLDEADRMAAQGHYKELSDILARLPHPANRKEVTEDPEFEELRRAKEAERGQKGQQHQQKPNKEKTKGRKRGKEEEEEEEVEEQDEEGRGRWSRSRRESDHGEGAEPMEAEEDETEEKDDDDGESDGMATVEEDKEEDEEAEGEEERSGKKKKKKNKKLLLQTFVFSATLTLPLFLKKRLRRGGGGAGGGAATLESLMDRVPFRTSPPPRVVDLTPQRRLADRVTEAAVSCLESERDEVLYYLLAAHPGRTLVFANAVSAIRRVAALLKELGLPALALHAQQQQRQRLKALDRFRAQPQAVLVATDVAARGLDIPGVSTVVHYQLPASADTYIHRCGRTARGLEGDGISIALVTPGEVTRFAGLARVLGRDPPPAFPIDQSLLPQVRARVRLAIRLDDIERKERKQRAEESWRRANAKALGLDASDDEDGGGVWDEDEEGGGKRLRNGRHARPSAQATALRQQLAALLAEPLAPKMSRRYFTGGLAAAVATRSKEPAAGDAAARKAAAGAAAAAAAADAAALPGAVTAAVPKAVALASKLHQSHQAAAAAVEAARAKKLKSKKLQVKATAAAGIKPGASRRVDPRLLVSRNQLKKQHHRGMVVIPQAFGRDAAAPNALDALRERLAALGSSSAAAASSGAMTRSAAVAKAAPRGGAAGAGAEGTKRQGDGKGGKGGQAAKAGRKGRR